MTNKHLAATQAWSTEVHQERVVIRVAAGTIWVTQEGDGEDHVLTGPAVFISRPEGRVALETLTDADLEVSRTAGADLRQAA